MNYPGLISANLAGLFLIFKWKYGRKILIYNLTKAPKASTSGGSTACFKKPMLDKKSPHKLGQFHVWPV